MNVKMEYYIPQMKILFPDIPENKIRRIIIEGCHKIMHLIVNGRDINLDNKKLPVKMMFYKGKPFFKKKKKNGQTEEGK